MVSCLHDSLLCVKNSPHVPCPTQIINFKMILSSIHDDDLIRYRRLNGYMQDAWLAIYKSVNSKWRRLRGEMLSAANVGSAICPVHCQTTCQGMRAEADTNISNMCLGTSSTAVVGLKLKTIKRHHNVTRRLPHFYYSKINKNCYQWTV